VSDTHFTSEHVTREGAHRGAPSNLPRARHSIKNRIRVVPILITLGTVALSALLGWTMWDTYRGAPWTRDGAVRAYVVTMAPEVAGRIVQLPVEDNQFVHRGDLLMVIDSTDYAIAVDQAEAAVTQARTRAC
jgi:multidrug resistance efflux pump